MELMIYVMVFGFGFIVGCGRRWRVRANNEFTYLKWAKDAESVIIEADKFVSGDSPMRYLRIKIDEYRKKHPKWTLP